MPQNGMRGRAAARWLRPGGVRPGRVRAGAVFSSAVLALIMAAVLALAGVQVGAQVPGDQIIVIGDDRGGGLNTRAQLIEQIRAAHARVEIRGAICYSACTMYLGAGDVCVSPQTTFGFHGPTRNGRPLAPDDAERWSAVVARYYPPGLREWFMTTGRHETAGLYRLSGADLIRAGFPAC